MVISGDLIYNRLCNFSLLKTSRRKCDICNNLQHRFMNIDNVAEKGVHRVHELMENIGVDFFDTYLHGR